MATCSEIDVTAARITASSKSKNDRVHVAHSVAPPLGDEKLETTPDAQPSPQKKHSRWRLTMRSDLRPAVGAQSGGVFKVVGKTATSPATIALEDGRGSRRAGTVLPQFQANGHRGG